jgi:hypothetical protein
MKAKILLGIFFVFALASFVSAGCPGIEFAKIKIDYSFNPTLNGIELEVGPSCGSSHLGFGIRNYKNDDILVYVDGKSTSHEIWPYQETKERVYNSSLPYCNRAPGYGACSSEIKCSAANAPIINDYLCFDNQVCCDFGDVDKANEWYAKSFYKEEDIPQEVGAEWTRELYFKSSPNEKIILSAKNVPTNGNVLPIQIRDNTLYYVLGAIALIVIIVLIVLKFRKR